MSLFASLAPSISQGLSSAGAEVSNLVQSSASSLKQQASGFVQNISDKIGNFTSISKDIEVVSESGPDGVIRALRKNSTGELTKLINSKNINDLAGFQGATSKQINSALSTNGSTDYIGHRVQLYNRADELEKVICEARPQISESRSVDYNALDLIHHPGAVQKYIKTQVRTWSYDLKLISRTADEATENLAKANLIRSWTMPYFGAGTAVSDEYAAMLGAPPPILIFQAYGANMIGPVPTVLTSYSITWPADVDYFFTADRNSFPVLVDISIQLTESFSPAEHSGFDLLEYKLGNMLDAYPVNNYLSSSEKSSNNEVQDSGDEMRARREALRKEAQDKFEASADSGDEIRFRREAGNFYEKQGIDLLNKNYVPRNSGLGFFGADDGLTRSMSQGKLLDGS